MESLMALAFTSLKDSPGSLTTILAIASLLFGGVMYYRKASITEVTSVGAMQNTQIDSLLKQVALLSEELTKARKQLQDIHNQNVELMGQIRASSMKIQELEDIVHKLRSKDNWGDTAIQEPV